MPADRVTIRLAPETAERIESLAAERSLTTSELIREALEGYLDEAEHATPSALEAAERAGIIGIVDDLPADLSQNPRHLQGFGER